MDNPLRRPQGTFPRGHISRDHGSRHRAPRGSTASHPPPLGDLERQHSSIDENDSSAAKTTQAHLVAMSGEFIGTIMFLFMSFGGTQIANNVTPSDHPDVGQLLYISLSFGFSLAVTAWIFYRVSGGLFNPAVGITLF